MKVFLLTTLYLLLCLISNSQSRQEPAAIFYTNSASRTMYNQNPDSAMYYIRKLADSSTFGNIDLFSSFIHNSFAQPFGNHSLNQRNKNEVKGLQKQVVLAKRLLYKLYNDTSRKIQQAVNPIYLAVQVRDSVDSNKAVTNLVYQFINQHLSGDIYVNRGARYGLYIYNIISKKKDLQPLSESLLASIKHNLKTNEPAIAPNRLELEKRAWYRYLYAYVCSRQAEKTKNIVEKKKLLQQAFQYSPDALDVSNKGQFFYDMIFLLNEEKLSFREEYLHFLKNGGGSKDEILAALTTMAVLDIGYKQKLKAFYAQNYAMKQSFDKYWLQLSASQAKEKAPLILLTLLNNKIFSSEDQKGKWVLIDFWGTWCVPCRKEHPDLEKFYKSVVVPNPDKISLLTIACRDRDELVSNYMEEKGFTFPVAMADSSVERLYKVQSYPTKVLITPEGNYILIPFGFDWTNFVKEIVDL